MLQSVRIDDGVVEAACAGAGDREEEFRTEATEIEQMKACLRMEYVPEMSTCRWDNDVADNPHHSLHMLVVISGNMITSWCGL